MIIKSCTVQDINAHRPLMAQRPLVCPKLFMSIGELSADSPLPQYMVRPVIASRVKNNELICANIFRVY